MRRGRPPAGVHVIDQLTAPAAVRRRVRIVLATLTGERSIADACTQLGVRRSRVYALRRQVLQGAVDALQARPRGRPRVTRPDEAEVRSLRQRVHELELALRATQLRSEIALTMPFLLDRAGRKKKDEATRSASRSRAARAGAPRAGRRSRG